MNDLCETIAVHDEFKKYASKYKCRLPFASQSPFANLQKISPILAFSQCWPGPRYGHKKRDTLNLSAGWRGSGEPFPRYNTIKQIKNYSFNEKNPNHSLPHRVELNQPARIMFHYPVIILISLHTK